jgi:hypothetical protein
MKRFLGALSAVSLSGALCLTATGTAQAVSGDFTCGLTSYNPSTGTVTTTICWGGPANATSGTITDNTTNARYRCATLLVQPFGSFFYLVDGLRCTQL